MFRLLQTLCLYSSVLCCKCFVFHRYVQRVIGHGPGAGGRSKADGAHDTPEVLDEACSSSSGLSGPTCTEREDGVRGKEWGCSRGARAGWGKADGGSVHMRVRAR